MGKYSEALRLHVEAHEAEVRATLAGLDLEGLAEWCKTQIDNHIAVLTKMQSCLDPKPIMSRAIGHGEEILVLMDARRNVRSHNALVELVRERRIKGEYIPEVWRVYLFDVYLGIRKKPDGRGKSSQSMRDDAICRCIQYLVDFRPPLNPTRNEANDDITSAADIVAKALPNQTHGAVAKIWNKHTKRLKDTDLL